MLERTYTCCKICKFHSNVRAFCVLKKWPRETPKVGIVELTTEQNNNIEQYLSFEEKNFFQATKVCKVRK